MERKSAKQRIISDIKSGDVRIQVTGYIKQIKTKDYLLLDDESGPQIKVDIKNVDVPFKEKHLINVIGDLHLTMEGEKEIEADIIQDMENLNFEYYKKIYKIKKTL